MWKKLWKEIKIKGWLFITIRKAKYKMKTTRRGSIQLPWTTLRANITADESAMAVNQMTFAHISNYSHSYSIAEGMAIIELRFLGLAEDNAADTYIYLARENDDLCLACIGTLTVGQQLATGGKYYVETITLQDRWVDSKEVSLADAHGNNGMSRMILDVAGYKTLIVLVVDTGSYSWDVDISGFSL